MRNKTIQSISRRTISFTGLLLLLLIAISQLACPELVGLIEEPKKEEETDTGQKLQPVPRAFFTSVVFPPERTLVRLSLICKMQMSLSSILI